MFYSAKLKLITIYLSSMIKRVIKCSPYALRSNSWLFHTWKIRVIRLDNGANTFS